MGLFREDEEIPLTSMRSAIGGAAGALIPVRGPTNPYLRCVWSDLLNSTWWWGDRIPSVFPHPVNSDSIQFTPWESGVARAFLLPHANYHVYHSASGHIQRENSAASMCRVVLHSRI